MMMMELNSTKISTFTGMFYNNSFYRYNQEPAEVS